MDASPRPTVPNRRTTDSLVDNFGGRAPGPATVTTVNALEAVVIPTQPARPLVALRAARRDQSSLYVSLERMRTLLLDGLSDEQAHSMLALGATSTTHLRAVADSETADPATAQVMQRLARAAESASLPLPTHAHVAVSGRGHLASAVHAVVDPYVHRLTHDPAALARLAYGTRGSYGAPDLAVIVTDRVLDVLQCKQWQRRGVPQLPVVVDGDRVTVGPVLAVSGGACAQCLELHRTDHDPGRPSLAAVTARSLDDPPSVDPDPALGVLAAGLTGVLVRNLLSGVPVPEGLALSVELPYPRVSHHAWRPHLRCPCVTMGA